MKWTLNKTARGAVALALAGVLGVGLSGCAQAGGNGAGQAASSDAKGDITFRVWDEDAAKAYEKAIPDFEKANPNVKVKLEVVPWKDYFVTLRNDVSAGTGPDVFWVNGANYRDYALNKRILSVDELLGKDAKSAWNDAVVAQYTEGGQLYGVPQITDGGSAVYYNKAALDKAGVKPEDIKNATWHPTEPAKDTLLPILKKLTVDANGKNATESGFDATHIKQYGFNAAQDLQNIELNFIGGNGGTYQDKEGKLTLSNPKTVEAYSYLVKLINEEHVAPPASSTNDQGDFTRDEFIKGNIALFESGTYNLSKVHDNASFEWGLTEIPSGPAGKVTTGPGVIAAANAGSKSSGATKAFLAWLGTADANKSLAASGTAVPGVKAARATFDEYWKQQKIDVSPFFTVLEGKQPLPSVTGQKYAAMAAAYKPKTNEVFLGRVPVADGLKAADEAGNAAAK